MTTKGLFRVLEFVCQWF